VTSSSAASVLAVMLVAGLGCLAVSYLIGVASPAVHDEFAYLNSADTFLKGRFYNPTHPLWEFFETFHILQQPVNASKYFPGQAIFLAIGKYFGGHAIVGVWLSIAVFIGAAFWMFLGCTTWRFAMLGVFLMLTHFALTTYWAHSYWGGAAAAAGGALVVGALFRVLREVRPLDGVIIAVGFCLLAITRPYESVALALIVGTVLIVKLWRIPGKKQFLIRFGIPAGVVAIIGASLFGYYNYQITGSPTTLPYTVYEAKHTRMPLFLWQAPRKEMVYPHDVFESFDEELLGAYEQQHSVEGFVAEKSNRVRQLWHFFVGPVLALPLLLSLFYVRDIYVRISLAVVVLTLFSTALSVVTQVHYIAPAVASLYVLIVKALEKIDKTIVWKIPIGRVLSGSVIVGSLLILQLNLQKAVLDSTPTEWVRERNKIIKKLNAIEGDHLVVVRYIDRHLYIREWVYNEPDIDDAKIVWARDLGAEKNQRLFDYFPDRQVWRVNTDL
jgi:hypothetical protein